MLLASVHLAAPGRGEGFNLKGRNEILNRKEYITNQDYIDYEEYKRLEDKFGKVYQYSHKVPCGYDAITTTESHDTLKNIMYKHSERYIDHVEIIEEI